MSSSNFDLLHTAGVLLFGQRWQSEMARFLEVNDRTVRYWVAGTNPVPPGVWEQLSKEVRDRQRRLKALERKLAHT